ncbi:MAG: hypothetical protein EBV69_13480 [Oxalobacteraceae bacterium]|nr:hypothetical protein [Oxalobacteraceae bacterium]
MSLSSQFFIDLERGELCALDRFLERSRSTPSAAVLETSSAALSSALQAMQQTVRHAVQQLEKDALINEVSVAMQLLDEQADDEEVSNDASLALWKILDVIGPIEVRL